MQLRPHSVHQYAIRFGLAWPLTLGDSPYPEPVVLKQIRFTGPSELTVEEMFTTHEPPGDDDGDYPGDDNGDYPGDDNGDDHDAKAASPVKPGPQKPRGRKGPGR